MSTDHKVRVEDVTVKEFQEVCEGSAIVRMPKSDEVFYNHVQEFNRDISIQVIKLFSSIRRQEHGAQNYSGISILEALAASALRSIRYVKEIPGISRIVINDLDPKAVEAAKKNVELNGLGHLIDSTTSVPKISFANEDANSVMMSSIPLRPSRHYDSRFDVIDLDPYGSASPFLEAAVQAIGEGGLLCVTCTDMQVLNGKHAEKCFSSYGNCMSIPSPAYVHEQSLRMVLHAIDSTANRHGRYIVPLLSLSVDFYVRVFVRVLSSLAEVKNSSLKRCFVFQTVSPTPLLFATLPVGEMGSRASFYRPCISDMKTISSCIGSKFQMGGPMWSTSLHDDAFAHQLLAQVSQISTLNVHDAVDDSGRQYVISCKQRDRIKAVLTVVSEEIPDMFYYLLENLCSWCFRSQQPQQTDNDDELVGGERKKRKGSKRTRGVGGDEFKGLYRQPTMAAFNNALINAGYRVSRFHHEATAVKTSAPGNVVWAVMTEWKERETARISRELGDGKVVEDVGTGWKFDFETCSSSSEVHVARFPQNPERFWGPKSRAGKAKRKANDDDNDT